MPYNPNKYPKARNISRSFATDRNFNLAFSQFVYGLGKNGSGNTHFSFTSYVSSTEAYPVAFTPEIAVKYEVDLIFIGNLQNESWMMFHVSEFRPTDDETGEPKAKYLSSFKVPVSFDLEAIRRSYFERPAIIDGENIRFESGLGGSLFVINKTGLSKIDEVT
uniref:Uncharacterized protein n=1 Tax=Rhizobium phage IG49 TaxID=3129228 RepID=A0AAU8HZ88_9CAUD